MVVQILSVVLELNARYVVNKTNNKIITTHKFIIIILLKMDMVTGCLRDVRLMKIILIYEMKSHVSVII